MSSDIMKPINKFVQGVYTCLACFNVYWSTSSVHFRLLKKLDLPMYVYSKIIFLHFLYKKNGMVQIFVSRQKCPDTIHGMYEHDNTLILEVIHQWNLQWYQLYFKLHRNLRQCTKATNTHQKPSNSALSHIKNTGSAINHIKTLRQCTNSHKTSMHTALTH